MEGKQIYLSGKCVNYVLISRRDIHRTGMRFLSRGADIDGNVSNFAETEQIVSIKLDNSYRCYSFI